MKNPAKGFIKTGARIPPKQLRAIIDDVSRRIRAVIECKGAHENIKVTENINFLEADKNLGKPRFQITNPVNPTRGFGKTDPNRTL